MIEILINKQATTKKSVFYKGDKIELFLLDKYNGVKVSVASTDQN